MFYYIIFLVEEFLYVFVIADYFKCYFWDYWGYYDNYFSEKIYVV